RVTASSRCRRSSSASRATAATTAGKSIATWCCPPSRRCVRRRASASRASTPAATPMSAPNRICRWASCRRSPRWGAAPSKMVTSASVEQLFGTLVDEGDLPIEDGHVDGNILDALAGDREGVLRQHGKIGKLTRLDRALDALVEAVIGRIYGEHAQRLRHR